MASEHALLLLRHAQAIDSSAGLRDHQRPLSDRGLTQAAQAGAALRERGIGPDFVLCSSSVRTRQTWEQLGLNARVEFSDEVYNAGSDTLLEQARLFDEATRTTMIIGHAPGLPALAAQLAGPGSDQQALDVVNSRFPAATVSEFSVEGPWADLLTARLVWLRLGH